MATINPYLNFRGNTEEAFNFYRSVFGGEFAVLQRFKDVPNSGMPPEDQDKLMHVSLPIGGNVLMGTDAVGLQGKDYIWGNNFQLSVAVDSKEEAEKIFSGLSAGGEIKMPLQETFWAPAFGMLNDKFGIQWMVNYDGPKK
ncbi:MAG: VOC family protein [Mucilaginibacter sp.]